MVKQAFSEYGKGSFQQKANDPFPAFTDIDLDANGLLSQILIWNEGHL